MITGAQPQYHGSGTINGTGNYGFLVTALDGGGHGADKFRIKAAPLNSLADTPDQVAPIPGAMAPGKAKAVRQPLLSGADRGTSAAADRLFADLDLGLLPASAVDDLTFEL